MRILHIGKYYPPVAGGMERFLGDLVRAQRAQGHDVRVLVHDLPGAKRAAGDPPWLERCPTLVKLLFAPISPRFPFWLARAIRVQRPEVIHLHVPNLSAIWLLLMPAARAIPWVIHWQSDVVPSKHKRSLRLLYPVYSLFERAMLDRAERIIATSPQYLEASAPLAPWRFKCDIVPLGVAPARLPDVPGPETDGLWKGQGLRVLALGRLTYYKGFDTLLRAALTRDDIELVIAGEGEERPKLEALVVAARNPGAARLVGEIDDETACRLLASCDVFCLPSRERTESFGIALVEAMRYAKPLLVGDVPGSGMQWVARHGENAVHVPPDNPAAWRSALDAMAADPSRRKSMGMKGRRRYLRDFDIARVSDQVTRIYELALASRTEDPPPAPIGRWRTLVVIPALNEEDCIGGVVREAIAQGGVDVLVIDDGSTDRTAELAREAGAQVLSAPLWQGAWGAIQTGIRYARRNGYAGVVTMDADGQHEPKELPRLIEAAKDADVVIAACPARGSRLRHVAWSYFRFLTGFNYEDLTSGFRYYNARACEVLATREATLLDYQDIGVLLLLRHAKLRIAEIPVAMNPRVSGISRVFFSWWTIVGYMAETSLLCLARWDLPRNRR